MMIRHGFATLLLMSTLSGCASFQADNELVDGPPVRDIVTPYDEALDCLGGKISDQAVFGVGRIPDLTGLKVSRNNGGPNITQGAGDIVQSALLKADVTVVNRRDMGTAVLESQWGIRDLSQQIPTLFAITGSINSLDYIPPSGFEFYIGGVGPRKRNSSILVGLDLAVTNTQTGQIVSNVSLKKRIVAGEHGFGANRVVRSVILSFESGVSKREALNFALREMLQLATFDLLTQLMPSKKWNACAQKIEQGVDPVGDERPGDDRSRENPSQPAKAES